MGWSGIKEHGFGKRPKEVDDAYRAKAREVPRKKRYWTKAKCVEELEDCLSLLKKILMKEEKISKNKPEKLKKETIRDLNTMMNRVLEYMKYLYPPVQQNLNVNVEMTMDKYAERLAKRLQEKYGIVVVKDEEEKEEDKEEVVVEDE